MVKIVRHCQPKGAGTDRLDLNYFAPSLYSAGNDLIITPTLILPHQGGRKFFRELDAPQLCCGVLH